jgi:hypothetical protein
MGFGSSEEVIKKMHKPAANWEMFATLVSNALVSR